MRARTMLLIALLLPILALAVLTFYKRQLLMSGVDIVLPVTGYDPRDFLSGHYVIYTVDYGTPNICYQSKAIQQGYVCLDNKSFSFSPPENCNHFISGTCNAGRFIAGIEKYYIPENAALHLDTAVRNKNVSIVVSVPPNGQAQVKELLINGKSWR
jgi:uncharacterized membrane-anchored protein